MNWLVWLGAAWAGVLVVGGVAWMLYRLAIEIHEDGRRWRR